MIHIAMLLSNPFPPDLRVLKEARSLTQAGYKVTIVCWDRKGKFAAQERIEGFDVHRLAIRSNYSAGSRQMFYLPRFWQAALKELRILKPDIIHCHDLDTTPAGYWYACTRHIPWVFDAHECYPEQIGPQVNKAIYYLLLFLERQMARRATLVITVGELLAQRFRSLGGTVSVVGNYQSWDTFSSRCSISRADLGLSSDEFIVAYIGGFSRARVILPLVKATKIFPNVTVLLAGAGPQRAEVERILPDYPRVHDLNWIPPNQVLDYMALTDVIYYGLDAADGNNQYSSPNTLFNALIVGKPILTTNVGEIAHIVRNEECGVIVEQPTPSLLAQAMMQLYDPDFRKQLAFNARQIAQSKYNWTMAEANLVNAYRQITP